MKAFFSAILLKGRWAAILVEVGKRGEAEEWGGKRNSEVAAEAETARDQTSMIVMKMIHTHDVCVILK